MWKVLIRDRLTLVVVVVVVGHFCHVVDFFLIVFEMLVICRLLTTTTWKELGKTHKEGVIYPTHLACKAIGLSVLSLVIFATPQKPTPAG